jgi:EmrB/QacA subfamily drug resistance transporter
MRSGREIPLSAGVVLFLAPALGPTLGGVLVATWGWPFIFLVNVPIGVAALAGLPHVWRRGFADEVDRSARFDPFGLLLLSLGVTGVLYGTSEAPTRGWFTLGVMPFWVLGTVALLGYARWAWRRDEPAVDLRLLRHPQSALTVGLCVIAALAMFGVLFLVPVLVQNVQGHTALESGLVLLPQGVVMGISSALGRKLTGGWLRPGIVVGFVAVAGTSLLLLRVELDTPLWMTALIMAGRGFGVGLVIQPLLTGTLAGLPRRELDHANTLFNVGQRIGGSVGVSLLATLFSVRAAHHVAASLGLPATGTGLNMSGLADVPAPLLPTVLDAVVSAFHETVWVAAAVAVAGVLGALFVRSRPAADSPEPAAQVMESR